MMVALIATTIATISPVAASDTSTNETDTESGISSFTDKFTCAWTNAPAGTTIAFEDASSGDSAYTETAWTWDFGDGTTSNVQDPVHTYASPVGGETSVSLTVTLVATPVPGGPSVTTSATTSMSAANCDASQLVVPKTIPVTKGHVKEVTFSSGDKFYYVSAVTAQMPSKNTVVAEAVTLNGKTLYRKTYHNVRNGTDVMAIIPVHRAGATWSGSFSVSSPGHATSVQPYGSGWCDWDNPSKCHNYVWYVKSWARRTYHKGTAKIGHTIAVSSPLTATGRRAGAAASYRWWLECESKTTAIGSSNTLTVKADWKGCNIEGQTWVAKNGYYGSPPQWRLFGPVS